MEQRLSFEYSPKLVLTKLQSPPLQSKQIVRHRLLSMMTEKERNIKLTLVQAPAGYGKSVVLAQYLRHCQTSKIPTLWITLDNADNDLDRLVRHLHVAWSSLESESTLTNDTFSQGLLERLSNSTQPFVLFFDEFEVIHNPIVLRYIQQIIEYLPSSSEIVIGSRRMPDLGIGRLRSRNQLLELTHKDLCFSFQETSELLHNHYALSLQDKDIKVLIHRTEGWISAIHLAVLALDDHREASQFFNTFSGSHAELGQLLAEDILTKLEVSHRDFLLHTSVLTELNADLCNTVTLQKDAEDQLGFLIQNNLFLIALDNTRSHYRYHGLFSSYLLDRLKATQPELFIKLHRRAADWYLKQNRPLKAIDHLLFDTDQQAAAILIDQHAMSLLNEGRVRCLLRWFDRLSPNLLRQRPALKLIFAWALVLNRRHQDALSILNEFLNSPTLPIELIQQANTLKCLQLAMTDQILACYQLSKQQLDKIESTQALQYGVLITTVAYCLITAGKYEEARQTLANALQQDLGLQATFIQSICDALEGWIDLIQARMKQATLRLKRGYDQVWLNNKKGIPGGKAIIGVPYAELLYERNELDRAQIILGECLMYARENGTVDSLISAYLMQSRISRHLGDHESAHRLLQELEDVGIEHGLMRVIASVKLENARIFWLDGDLQNAQIAIHQVAEMKKRAPESYASCPAHDIESEDIMIWRLMIATGQAAQAENEIKQAIKLTNSAQRYRRLLKLRILHCIALFESGKLNFAMRALTDALKIANQEGFIRIFLDEGKSIEPLLNHWMKHHSEHAEQIDISKLWSNPLFQQQKETAQTTVNASPATVTTQILTKRELQVLMHLAKGSRTTTIAESLFVSEVTIKAHLRNINSKLGAHGRIEAVAIARELKLLP